MERYLIADFNETYGREPVIRKMKNDTLICVMITGGPTEPHNENIVVICKSYDDGKTWTKPRTLFSHSCRGVWVPEIFTEYEYPIMFVHTYNADCPHKELQTLISYTYDNGESWTSPVSFGSYINGVSVRQGIKLSNGDCLFPIYFTEIIGNYDWKDRIFEAEDWWDGFVHKSGVLISSNNGKTYQRYGYFSDDKSLWEPNCVELENGHVVTYIRNSAEPYLTMSESFDYGRTWSDIKNLQIYNSNSKITALKVNEKVILISNVNNGLKYTERTHLQINISDDYCKTWRSPILIQNESDNYFYPHAFVDYKKKTLYVAYENGKQHFLEKYTFKELFI